MSNFTKSILYTTTVLAAGLVAIFAIYDGFSKEQAAQVAAVEPAAGESDFGLKYDEEANTIAPSAGEAASAEATPAAIPEGAPAETPAAPAETAEAPSPEATPAATEPPAATDAAETAPAPASTEADATKVEPAAEGEIAPIIEEDTTKTAQ